MKFKREIIAIILIICMLFTISAISAADSSDEAISAVNETAESVSVANDDSLEKINDGEILGDGNSNIGTFTDLKNNISNAATTLELNNDFELSTDTDGAIISNIGIDIQKTLTIDGKALY